MLLPRDIRSLTGFRIGLANLVITVKFALFSVLAAVFGDALYAYMTIFSLTLSALGCAIFLRALFHLAGRSRHEEVSVAGAFLLLEEAAIGAKAFFWSMLGIQLASALIAAGTRFYTPLAFGILVPVFGVGMMSLWGAKHARFPAKSLGARRA